MLWNKHYLAVDVIADFHFFAYRAYWSPTFFKIAFFLCITNRARARGSTIAIYWIVRLIPWNTVKQERVKSERLLNLPSLQSCKYFRSCAIGLHGHMTEYAPVETEEYEWYSPIFRTALFGKKSLKENERNSLHLAQKCALIYFSGRHLSWEAKTVNFKEQMTSADKCLQTASCATWKLFPRLKQNDYQWKEAWIGLFHVLNSPIPIQRSPLEFDIFRVERSPAHVQLINFSPPALIFRKIRTVPLGRCLLLLVRTCSMHRARHGLPPRARCGRDVINFTAKSVHD